MRDSALRTLFVVLALGASVSCKEVLVFGPPCTDPQGGSFTGTVSGAQSGQVFGCASYAVTSGGSGSTSALVLSAGPIASPTTVVSLVRGDNRPAVGTYNIGVGAGDFAGSIFVSSAGQTFSLTSGTVTITLSTAGSLEGDIHVTGTQSGSNSTITIDGGFEAVCTAGGSVSC